MRNITLSEISVRIDCEPDHTSSEDAIRVLVTVTAAGFTGSDSLAGVILSTGANAAEILETVAADEMIATAVDDLNKTIRSHDWSGEISEDTIGEFDDVWAGIAVVTGI